MVAAALAGVDLVAGTLSFDFRHGIAHAAGLGFNPADRQPGRARGCAAMVTVIIVVIIMVTRAMALAVIVTVVAAAVIVVIIAVPG
jgi:hypothetical protein